MVEESLLKDTILRYPFHLVTLVTIALLVWVWTGHQQTVEVAQAMTRLTARVSAIIFLFIFSASSWHRLSSGEWSASLLKNRRRLGVTFAYSHTIHLFCFVAFFWLADRRPSLSTMIIGGGAYLTMYAMALTSNDSSVKKLGAKNWKRLHKFGVYYLWLVFFLTYLTRFLKAGDSMMVDVAGMALFLAMILMRGAATVFAKRRLTYVAPDPPGPI
jgi:DMSO/TMAO reductase YedYZ heme-binding membrane subunit